MIDLHIHTTNSDGAFTAKEILQKAQEKGLEIIAITDHDNINAYNDLDKLNIKEIYDGKIIIGAELAFVYEGKIFEMLGYGLDLEKIKNSEIIKRNSDYSTVEKEKNILDKLKKVCDRIGITYSKDLKVTTPNYLANDVLVDDILQYPENKNILEEMNILDRGTFYRKHICEETSPFFIDKTKGKPDIFYVASLIHEAGGLCFLAHPFVYNLKDTKETIEKIVSMGIIYGIECAHRRHNEEQIKFLIDYCNKNNLLKSCGSDFHIEKHCLGFANNGKHQLDKELVSDWIESVMKNKYNQ